MRIKWGLFISLRLGPATQKDIQKAYPVSQNKVTFKSGEGQTALVDLPAFGKVVDAKGDLGRAYSWGFTENGFYKVARNWFAEVAKPGFVEPASFIEVDKAFVGDFCRFAHTLGLISCVLNVTSSFDAMSESGANSDDPVGARDQAFAKVNFALGVVLFILRSSAG
ncbi:hypothetical protein IL306_001943 [Fusarium sp. DS 682]|nr:hypothetical protein IL306_001943 [Fusarium sp. DS 682]